jgi:sugar O-acyltransferase (sialic acid O-acetyltransferase NeuD family)
VRPILLVGGGGHCRSVIDVIEAGQSDDVYGIVEREGAGSQSVLGYSVLGSDHDLVDLIGKCSRVHIAIGQVKSSRVREELFDLCRGLGADFPVLLSPKAYVSKRAVLGMGTITMHGSVVNAGARVGQNCIINTLAVVEHDVAIGAHCHISTGARVNGGATIGSGTFVGSGAILHEHVTVGTGCVIGAGAVIDRNIESGTWVKGRRQ